MALAKSSQAKVSPGTETVVLTGPALMPMPWLTHTVVLDQHVNKKLVLWQCCCAKFHLFDWPFRVSFRCLWRQPQVLFCQCKRMLTCLCFDKAW